MAESTPPPSSPRAGRCPAFGPEEAKVAWLRRRVEEAQPQADTPWPGATSLFYGQASSWGEGPWAGEPDFVRWVEAKSGLHCLARRSSLGAWCGYVAVESSHPLHGKGYDEAHAAHENLSVHGGLTFAQFCEDDGFKIAICHDHDAEKPAWWFGFDCAHGGDFYAFYQVEMFDAQGKSLDQERAVQRLCPPTREQVVQEAEKTYKTLDYVRNEAEDLAHQLKKMVTR